MKSRGFTLLELLIVMTIMGTLMVYTTTAIKQALRSKVKIETQVADFSQIRDALKILERDINLAFHYSDIELELQKKIKDERKKLITGTTTTLPGGQPFQPPPPPPIDPNSNPALQGLDENGCYGSTDPLCIKSESRVDPTTHFIGKENSLAFVTMNASRIREDKPQADFIKVGYSLRSCKKPGDQGKGSNCLLRRNSSIAEGDVTKGGEEIILLQDIQEFKFRYLGKGKQDWVTDWNSIQGDAATKDKFPEAVEISVTVAHGEGEKVRKISMQIVSAIRFSNNPLIKQDGTKPAQQ